jgi:hypothetical protein
MAQEIPQGRLIIGRFDGTEQKKRKDGSEVSGMFEILVIPGTSMYPMRAVFFATDQDGDETKIAKQLSEVKPAKGDVVAVKIKSTPSGQYVNDEATGIVVVASGVKA